MTTKAAVWMQRARSFLLRDLWQSELEARSPIAPVLRLLQLGVMIVEGFVRDQLMVRVSALTYVTLLSMIPLLAVMLSLIDAFGLSQDLAELTVRRLVPGNPEAVNQTLALVREANIGSLGTLGAVLVFATSVLTLRHVERTLNHVWGVLRVRSWLRRFTDYLAVLVVAPLLMAVALALGSALQADPFVAWLLKNDTLATFYDFGLRFAPTGFFWVAFSFLYWFFPNTTVRPLSALLGGAVAALLFTFAQILFVDYASSAARYDALFGGFAALPLFLIWVYLSWAVILLGAEVSFAHQNLAQYRRQVQGDPLNDAEREALALRIAVEVAAAFRDGRGPWTADALAEAVDVPVRAVREVIQPLEAAGLIQACAVQEREGAYQLGRAAESIRVSDVLEALRGRWPAETGAQGPAAETVRAVFREWAASLETSVGPRPLSELLTAIPPRQGGPDRG